MLARPETFDDVAPTQGESAQFRRSGSAAFWL